MRKLILLTPAIIRGHHHFKTIGKFYKDYSDILSKYEIYHIINIDQPKHLKNYFTVYETIDTLNKCIPEFVHKEYNITNEPGFLKAYINLLSKLSSLNILDDDSIVWWYEDDWINTSSYNIFSIVDFFSNYKNTAITFTQSAPLGSFRCGPLMTKTYYESNFNIGNNLNDTCDPEKQIMRWLSGINRKNGNGMIHRNYKDNNIIQLFLFYTNNKKYDHNDFLHSRYNEKYFDKGLKFEYHFIRYNNSLIEYSPVVNNKINVKIITKSDLDIIFNNNYIKYIYAFPQIFTDYGRKFNDIYGLNKWSTINDNTTYVSKDIVSLYLGNWQLLTKDLLRLRPTITHNNDFFASLSDILQVLPYLYEKNFKHNILPKIEYISHCYGKYPNFEVLDDIIEINYIPNATLETFSSNGTTDIGKILNDYCGSYHIIRNDCDINNYHSFMNNFKLANKYFNKYFKINNSVNSHVDDYALNFNNTLGVCYQKPSKTRNNYYKKVNDDDFIKIINYIVAKEKYISIFISSDDNTFNDKLISAFPQIKVIKTKKPIYDDLEIVHAYNIINDICTKIKREKNFNMKVKYEMELKNKSHENNKLVLYNLSDAILLSKCNYVITTTSILSSFSKIINPDLKIYRINACYYPYFPIAYIDLYDHSKVDDDDIKNILLNLAKGEISNGCKYSYKMMYDSPV